jgi:hypothetical protein
MSNYINNNSSLESQRTPLEDLAAELSIDVEALEERLEMVSIDATACCIVNVGCPIKPL